ncbi:MAG: flippase-like domain-containing protein [candidate division Zixibacteria bacterium]|jgi:hypothetical protein|nr:flippase-like domain-containing protein [candidate division Zixibacteria bacterium]
MQKEITTFQNRTVPGPEVSSGKSFKDIFNIHRLLKFILIMLPLMVLGSTVYVMLTSEAGSYEYLKKLKFGYLLLAAVMVMIPFFTNSARLYLWSRVINGGMKPSIAFKATVVGELGNVTTPTAIGGGYLKLYYLTRQNFNVGQVAMIYLLGYIEDFIFLILFLSSTILLTQSWNNPHVLQAGRAILAHWWVFAIIAGIGISFSIYVKNRVNKVKADLPDSHPKGIKGLKNRILSRIQKFEHDMKTAFGLVWRHGKGTFLTCIMLAIFGWGCRYMAINALIAGMGLHTDILNYALLHWLVFTFMTLVPSPGAVGGAEIVFALIFGGLLPGDMVPVLTGSWRLLTCYLGITFGAFYLIISGMGLPSRNKFVRKHPEEVLAAQKTAA